MEEDSRVYDGDQTADTPRPLLPQDLEEDVIEATKEIHPKVDSLVTAFLNYLREPRFQNPLTLSELRGIFSSFLDDLTSLVFNIYTHSNTNKRSLIQRSTVFNEDIQTFDYLSAIANYSASSVKLSKRCDPEALFQLRVFGLYKFLTIQHTLELAQFKLYSSMSSPESISLYDKVFRFDSQDIEIQSLLAEKITILRSLNFPVTCFLDSNNAEEAQALEALFSNISSENNVLLKQVHDAFSRLFSSFTPMSKLLQIVEIQKALIRLCASCYNGDGNKVNNDLLLPAFIFFIINHLSAGEDELYLNFTFVRNFWKPFDPQNINVSRVTLTSSLSSYNPIERRNSGVKNNSFKTLSQLLILKDDSGDNGNLPNVLPVFQSDQALLSYIQQTYLNLGEFQYYLTNFEAILFFLSNTSIKEIVPPNFSLPDNLKTHDLVNLPLNEIIDKQNALSEPLQKKEITKLYQDELDSSVRSRSSSLFNTISSAVSHSVNRSRSNSAAFKHIENANGKETSHPTADFESSLNSNFQYEASGLSRVRNIFERFGSVPHLQFKQNPMDGDEKHENSFADRTPDTSRSKRSQSLLDRLSPIQDRNKNTYLESPSSGTNHAIRRATFSSKLSSGVSEFMTKISYAANNNNAASGSMVVVENNPNISHRSQSSLHSIDEPLEEPGFATRPPNLGPRSSSLQAMEKWFYNIPENSSHSVEANHRSNNSISSNKCDTTDSNDNEGSVFSASYGQLTKYQHTDFDSMTINDLKLLKAYYDQLCSEVLSAKAGSKSSNEFLPEVAKVRSSEHSLEETEKS